MTPFYSHPRRLRAPERTGVSASRRLHTALSQPCIPHRAPRCYPGRLCAVVRGGRLTIPARRPRAAPQYQGKTLYSVF